MARERRKFQRIAFEAKAVVVINGAELAGKTRDISVSGAFITGVSAKFGDQVVVSIAVDSSTVATLPGVVRWASSAGIGVQFALLGARETHVLTEIVRRRSAIEQAP